VASLPRSLIGQIGVDLYDDLNARISREECKRIFEIVRDEAQKIDSKLWIEIMGSYRRGQETSGDVDFLITRDTADGLTHAGVLPQLVHALKLRGAITHDVSAGEVIGLIRSSARRTIGRLRKPSGWESARSVRQASTDG